MQLKIVTDIMIISCELLFVSSLVCKPIVVAAVLMK